MLKSIYNPYYFAVGCSVGEYGFTNFSSFTLNGDTETVAEINKRLSFLPYPFTGLNFDK